MNTTKNEIKTDIELTIDNDAYIEMMRYAHLFSPNECSGTGLVKRVDYTDGSVAFNVIKVYLPDQVNTGVTTDIDDTEMAKVHTQVVLDGDDPALHKFHWHSHVDMSVFHSGTDSDNYNEMQTGDYAISLVVNKAYEMLASVHLYAPLRIDVLNIDVDAPDIDLDNYNIPKELRSKIEKNVARVTAYALKHTSKYTPYDWKKYRDTNCYGKGIGMYDDIYEQEKYGALAADAGGVTDPSLVALLEAGEREGLIVLDKDFDGTITGYYNTTSDKYYSLSTEVEYIEY
jgi:hypothetical protein